MLTELTSRPSYLVTERGIPQGDMLSLNASKIKDLQLTQDAAPSDGRRRNGRGRVPREQQKRNKEAFGSTGGADDESFSEDFDFAGNNAKFNKDEVFAQFKVNGQGKVHPRVATACVCNRSN